VNKSRANLALIAARASSRPVRTTIPAHLRPVSTVYATGPVKKSTALPLTGAQRDSRGQSSAWSRSAQIGGSLGVVVRDGKWSQTVGSQNV
jgi:hypothetical protein